MDKISAIIVTILLIFIILLIKLFFNIFVQGDMQLPRNESKINNLESYIVLESNDLDAYFLDNNYCNVYEEVCILKAYPGLEVEVTLILKEPTKEICFIHPEFIYEIRPKTYLYGNKQYYENIEPPEDLIVDKVNEKKSCFLHSGKRPESFIDVIIYFRHDDKSFPNDKLRIIKIEEENAP